MRSIALPSQGRRLRGAGSLHGPAVENPFRAYLYRLVDSRRGIIELVGAEQQFRLAKAPGEYACYVMEQYWGDDMESLGYVLLYLGRCSVP
jgi:hypothetical protein